MVILGGGIAGSSAAIAARQAGAAVTLVEKSSFPRHKVCGEFLSPGVLPLLNGLGLAEAFLALQPAPIRRVALNFSGREKRFPLPQAAYGLSRFELDRLLFERAIDSGAKAVKSSNEVPTIVASGRAALTPSGGPKGSRLFGFKAHFSGEVNDAVELYFFPGGYVGVNPVENGTTNVCGLCSEATLRKLNFQVDDLVSRVAPLERRLGGLKRRWDWLHVGPLVFANRFEESPVAFRAGDAVSFVDPFTGSGMLAALRSGCLAGRMAAEGRAIADYHIQVRSILKPPYAVSSFLRWAVWNSEVLRFAPLIPGSVLFRLTRPRA